MKNKRQWPDFTGITLFRTLTGTQHIVSYDGMIKLFLKFHNNFIVTDPHKHKISNDVPNVFVCADEAVCAALKSDQAGNTKA